jgi:hypothetical protein
LASEFVDPPLLFAATHLPLSVVLTTGLSLCSECTAKPAEA